MSVCLAAKLLAMQVQYVLLLSVVLCMVNIAASSPVCPMQPPPQPLPADALSMGSIPLAFDKLRTLLSAQLTDVFGARKAAGVRSFVVYGEQQLFSWGAGLRNMSDPQLGAPTASNLFR
jgi:hypothetical protein